MDPEEKQLLQSTHALVEENNKLLHKIRGVQNRAFLWQILKIIVIVGIALGSFYYVEPYLTKIMELYNTVSGTQQKMDNFSVQDLLKKF